MTESADDAAAASARAAEQARLRKERREAKIKAGGASRLNKITGLGGGIQRDPPPTPPNDTSAPKPTSNTTPSAAAAPEAQQHADPEEVDISQHYYAPRTSARMPSDQSADMSDAQLRRMMLGFDGPGGPGMGMDSGADGDDPMTKLLGQMMMGGGGSSNPFGGANPFGPGGNPFGPGSPFAQAAAAGPQDQTAVVPDRYSAIWRLLHTAVALGLGLYIALWTGFAGTKLQRAESSVTGSIGRTKRQMDAAHADTEDKFDSTRFFWAFATAEAVLLTTRYFLDRARPPPGGLLWTVAGLLPPPFKGYVEIAMRYGQIFGTVRSDVLVCVFVLGVCSWLRG